MGKKKSIAIFIFIFIIIGLIHGLISSSALNFISWILISVWLILLFKILENIKRHREFNSPHNTAFFVILPLFIGVIYSIWGPFSGFLGENLNGTSIYISWWSLIFAFPFILLGLRSLYHCFKKYNVVYFGKKSVKARILGYFISFSIIIFIIFYWMIFYSPLDFNLFILLISTILVLITFGFAGNKSSTPVLNRESIEARTRRINSLTNPTRQRQRTRTTRITNPTPSTRSSTTISRSRSQTNRRTPSSNRKTTNTSTKTTTRTTQIKTVKPKLKVSDLNKFKPKGSFLSVDDFKCIFCFKLPILPEDKGKGIVVCPNCRYPAHANEFKDWMRTSNLCSRCSAPIPTNFRRNPKIIPTKQYIAIYRYFLKKK
jgi:hypothetical protein